jgi:hypothetical protein
LCWRARTSSSTHRSEVAIDKDMERLLAGEIGFSVEDGKAIMAHLQQVVVKQQCEAYVLTSRFCTDCKGFRRIKDYSSARSGRCSAALRFEIRGS